MRQKRKPPHDRVRVEVGDLPEGSEEGDHQDPSCPPCQGLFAHGGHPITDLVGCQQVPVAVTAQYTEQISAMVSEDMRNYLDAEAERRGVSLAVVVREMLDISRSRAEEIERPEKEAEG